MRKIFIFFSFKQNEMAQGSGWPKEGYLPLYSKMQYLFPTTLYTTTNTLVRAIVVWFVRALEACILFALF